MSFNDLLARGQKLLDNIQSIEPKTLKGHILVTHYQSISDQLVLAFTESQNEDKLLQSLTTLLENNWQKTRATALCYTATPDSALTRRLIRVARYVADYQNSKITDERPPINAIELLMPDMCLESLKDEYPDLINLTPETLFNTYISGEGSYLIPVRLLSELDENKAFELPNVYYAYDKHPANQVQLSQEELSRLFNHSSETRALKDAHDYYKKITQDKSNFLDNLQHLCQQLHLNSVNGIGAEENAANGAYPAIIAFYDYYKCLADDEKKKIPPAVSNELTLLLSLSSDKKKNINATTNTDTCIATRRTELLKAIKTCENDLRAIAVSDENKTLLAEKAQKNINACRDILKKNIENNTYNGRDSLGLTRPLLESLQIKLSISSLADLHDFLTLSPDDINTLGQNEELKQQIISQIRTLEDWINLIIDTKPDTLKALLMLVGDGLIKKLIKDTNDVRALLITLSDERLDVVMNAIATSLTDIIKTGNDFKRVLEYLNPEQCAVVCTAVKDLLPGIIKTGDDFKRVLIFLNPEQRTVVCTAMKDLLPEIIKTVDDFKRVLIFLNPEQRTVVCTAMKDLLPEIIKRGYDFESVLHFLNPEQCTEVYTAMKDLLPEIIKTGYDFERVLHFLNPEQRTEVYTAMKDLLPEIIKTGYDFESVLHFLNPEQRTEVYTAMKGLLPEIIKTGTGFGWVLKFLNPEQRTEVCTAMKDRLPEIIKTGDDFKRVLEYLNPEQCAIVCAAMKDRLPGIIKAGDDFTQVLESLKPEQCEVVCAAMKDRLPEIIKTDDDFKRVLEYLNPEQRTEVYTAMKDRLPEIIKTGDDFGLILEFLNSEQCAIVCAAMKDRLPEIIKTGDDFGWVLLFLNPEQRTVVCTAMKDQLSEIIKTGDDFTYVLQYLQPQQCEVVCAAMKDLLPKIINSVSDLEDILISLTNERQKALLKAESIIYLLPKITNIHKNTPQIHSSIGSPEIKKAFFRAYFLGLLFELKECNKGLSDTKTIDCVNNLHAELTKEANQYFSDTPNNNYSPCDFQHKCAGHINAIKRNFREHQGLVALLGKILLAIVTFGLVPAAYMIDNKIKTGVWSPLCFFNTPGEDKADKLTSLLKPELTLLIS